jgi:hypothetical protein
VRRPAFLAKRVEAARQVERVERVVHRSPHPFFLPTIRLACQSAARMAEGEEFKAIGAQ